MSDDLTRERLEHWEAEMRAYRESLSVPASQMREVGRYSQRDPRWAQQIYAGGVTFQGGGCYVVSVTNLLHYIGYDDDPPTVASKLRDAGCFEGPNLSHPDLIPTAYPKSRYDGPVDVSQDGPLRWHNRAADMDRVWAELAKGPIIAEVDFRPSTAEYNQHLVVIESWNQEAGDDVIIIDPWDGARVALLERYALTWFVLLGHPRALKNAICGLRLLRAAEEVGG